LGFFIFSKIFKRAIFWVRKGGGDFHPPKGCFLSEMGGFFLSTPLGKGIGMVFFLKGPFQGVVYWVAWKGKGRVVSKGKGVVLFSFFFPFLKGVT